VYRSTSVRHRLGEHDLAQQEARGVVGGDAAGLEVGVEERAGRAQEPVLEGDELSAEGLVGLRLGLGV